MKIDTKNNFKKIRKNIAQNTRKTHKESSRQNVEFIYYKNLSNLSALTKQSKMDQS